MKKIYLFLAYSCVTVLGSGQNIQWAKSAGGMLGDNGRAIAVDVAGNAYTTGFFSGTADFDPSGSTYNLSSNGNYDIYIQKLDASGNFLWAKAIGGADDDMGNAIVVDPVTGDVYVSGQFRLTADFDPSAGTDIHASNGNYDICILKLDASGNFIWAETFGGPDWDYAIASALDASGNLYTTGVFKGMVDFNPNGASAAINSYGSNDSFVHKIDASGNFGWVKRIGGASADNAWGIDLDAAGNIYVSGTFQGSCDFDPSGATAQLTSGGGFDVFVLGLSSSGVYQWAKRVGGNGDDAAYGLTVDASHVLVSGYFTQTVDFDPSAALVNRTSIGGQDIFVLRLDVAGNYEWVYQAGGSGTDLGFCTAVDNNHHVFLAVSFQEAIDLNPSGTPEFLYVNGGNDGLILVLDDSGQAIFHQQTGGPGNEQTRAIAQMGGNLYATGYFSDIADFDMEGTPYELVAQGGSDIFVQKLRPKFTGVETWNASVDMLLYPNPTKSWVILHFAQEVQDAELFLYATNGQLVKQYSQISGTEFMMDVAALPAGVYSLEVRAQGKSCSRNLVKQ